MPASSQRGFFYSFLLIQVMAGMAYIALESILNLANVHILDSMLRFYFPVQPFPVSLLFLISSVVIFFAALQLWKIRPGAFRMYMIGKLMMAVAVVACLYFVYRKSDRIIPWQVLITYSVMWSLFPLLFLLINRKLNHYGK